MVWAGGHESSGSSVPPLPTDTETNELIRSGKKAEEMTATERAKIVIRAEQISGNEYRGSNEARIKSASHTVKVKYEQYKVQAASDVDKAAKDLVSGTMQALQTILKVQEAAAAATSKPALSDDQIRAEREQREHEAALNAERDCLKRIDDLTKQLDQIKTESQKPENTSNPNTVKWYKNEIARVQTELFGQQRALPERQAITLAARHEKESGGARVVVRDVTVEGQRAAPSAVAANRPAPAPAPRAPAAAPAAQPAAPTVVAQASHAEPATPSAAPAAPPVAPAVAQAPRAEPATPAATPAAPPVAPAAVAREQRPAPAAPAAAPASVAQTPPTKPESAKPSERTAPPAAARRASETGRQTPRTSSKSAAENELDALGAAADKALRGAPQSRQSVPSASSNLDEAAIAKAAENRQSPGSGLNLGSGGGTVRPGSGPGLGGIVSTSRSENASAGQETDVRGPRAQQSNPESQYTPEPLGPRGTAELTSAVRNLPAVKKAQEESAGAGGGEKFATINLNELANLSDIFAQYTPKENYIVKVRVINGTIKSIGPRLYKKNPSN